MENLFKMKNILSKVDKAKILFTEILEKRDFSWIDKIFSEHYGIKLQGEENLNTYEKVGTGKLGIKLYLNTFIQAFTEVKYTFLNIIESDNQVVIRWLINAKHVNDIFSIKATNKKLKVVGVSWFFFDSNELIKNIQLIWNGFSLMDQLELELRPKES